MYAPSLSIKACRIPVSGWFVYAYNLSKATFNNWGKTIPLASIRFNALPNVFSPVFSLQNASTADIDSLIELIKSYVHKDYFLIGVLFIIMFCLGSVFIVRGVSEVEFREYICTIAEGGFYICMCMALLYGFIMISLVMRIKMNYYR